MYLAYSPFHRPLQFQQTLQLHPWQSYPEPSSTPQGVFNLENGVNRRDLRAVVRENRGFFLKFGKCDLPDFDETLHIQSTLRINNFPAIIDFLAKRLPW